MKNIIFILLIFTTLGCYSKSDPVTSGEWKYKLIVNGMDAGTAVVSGSVKDGNYTTSSEYTMDVAGMKTMTRDIIIETTEFKPVRMENYTRIENDGETHESEIISVFKGREVALEFDGKKFNYTVSRDFILDGNFFMHSLLKAGFRKGYEVSNYVYNPSIELETPVKATAKVIGEEEIIINGRKQNLIHIVQSLEDINDNIDLYIDKKGILQKGIIHMLNLKIELIITE